MITYGFKIRMTHRNGAQEIWEVDRCHTLEQAILDCMEWAIRDGWTPPRWWQFWRWSDTRIPKLPAKFEIRDNEVNP